MRDPTSLQPFDQWQNTGLPGELFYQPEVVGRSHGFGRKGVAGDTGNFWDELIDDAGDVAPIEKSGPNTRQRLNDFSFPASTTSQQALPGNKNRVYFSIQNRGPSSVFVSFGKPANVGTSFEVPPGPGFAEPILGTTSSVHVVAATGNPTVVIVEGFRDTT